MQTICLNNLKQSGTAMAIYLKENSLYELELYYNFTGDHPFEGTSSRKGLHGPGNPAMWTSMYFTEDFSVVYNCPLTEHNKSYNMYPEDKGGVWGDYIYLYGKATNSNDPWKKKRTRYGLHTSLKKVNSESEDVVLTDYPDSAALKWMPTSKWKMLFRHYNALLKDNSAKVITYDDNKFYKWLFGNTTWGG